MLGRQYGRVKLTRLASSNDIPYGFDTGSRDSPQLSGLLSEQLDYAPSREGFVTGSQLTVQMKLEYRTRSGSRATFARSAALRWNPSGQITAFLPSAMEGNNNYAFFPAAYAAVRPQSAASASRVSTRISTIWSNH